MTPRKFTCQISDGNKPGHLTKYTARLAQSGGDWWWTILVTGLDMGGMPLSGKGKFVALSGAHDEGVIMASGIWANLLDKYPHVSSLSESDKIG